MASTDAKATAFWGVAHRLVFPLLDADGDLVTSAGSLDSEVSKDQGTFADCSNEATEIASASGMYYLDLTATEMEADSVAVIVKSASAKTTALVVYTEQGLRTRKAQAGAAGTLTLDASASAVDDFYNGCMVRLVGGTGVGQVRLISDYVGSTKVATVHPDWETTPSTDTIFHVQPLNADGIFYRDLATLQEADAEKKSLYTACAKLVNKVASAAGTTTVYRTDGATSHATQTETTDSSADPLTGLGGAA
jgi:hypothetical protein